MTAVGIGTSPIHEIAQKASPPDAVGEMVRLKYHDNCGVELFLGSFAFLPEQLASPETVKYPLSFARALRVDDSDDATTRSYAADALLVNPAEAAIEPLGKRLLEDEELQVRYRAARALAGIRGEEALKLLREALPDEDEETVRSAIESGIRQIEAEESGP